MNTKIFDDYGIEIYKRFAKYFLRIDNGELASRLVEAEISLDDATFAQKSSQDALNVITKYDKLGSFKEV